MDIVAPGEPGYDAAKNWVALPSYDDTGEGLGLIDDTFYVTSFEGLRTYTESAGIKTFDSYFLVETKAPEGYNLLDEPLEVTFTEEDSGKKHIHTESIENKKGFTLPNTGGIGTMLLVVVGIILIGLAVLLTMNKKKKAV
ncbi:LPXTG cell wall anchor domain-containing protein [Enterococcus sp. DIV0187]|uniref:LPXTG cell wall anchor domain-containing protein n=1 Tax=Enterococcus sp. DIV0187 TaxID=2774644 RepID=UPI003F287528